jgi:hypothetical protein
MSSAQLKRSEMGDLAGSGWSGYSFWVLAGVDEGEGVVWGLNVGDGDVSLSVGIVGTSV